MISDLTLFLKSVIRRGASAILALLLLLPLLAAAALPAAAGYAVSAEGELLFLADFTDKTRWSPSRTELASGTLSVTTAGDPLSAELRATTNSVCHNWGGEIDGLPLNGNRYTFFFTLIRDKDKTSKDPNFGFYFDSHYGFYGYSTNLRLLDNMTTLPNHGTKEFISLEEEVEGNNWGVASERTSVQNYAVEVDGKNKLFRVYVMTADGTYVYVDGTSKGEISSFYTENAGIWFHQYNTDMPITISRISVWKGLMLTSPEKLPGAPGTVPDTGRAEDPGDLTTSEAPVTGPEDTSASTDDDRQGGSGCSSSQGSAILTVAIAGLIPAIFLYISSERRRKNSVSRSQPDHGKEKDNEDRKE